ncbi:hypothetical protein [Mesobacillus jeotgali]|uniref:hypothetical protein n=1 Tax=Mesobacillus jeotgali TaxID=129985 RepID=UPI0009A734FF|nr:hypothetical protein [Mesobacillus jeotgali]
MWDWIWYFLLPIILLVIIEEVSQFIWRSYLKDSQEEEDSIIVRMKNTMNDILRKYRRNPSH